MHSAFGKIRGGRDSRRWRVAFLVCLLGFLGLPLYGQDSRVVRVEPLQSNAPSEMFVHDEFVVVLKRGIGAGLQLGRDQANRPLVSLPSLQQAIDRNGVVSFRRQFPTARPQPNANLPDLTGHFQVQLPAGVDLEVAMSDFARDPNVQQVEKIGLHRVYQEPNDFFYRNNLPHQWHYWDTYGIDANLAWDQETGNQSVVVAVLDTGVRYYHSDLGGTDPPGPADKITNGNVWVNSGEVPGNGIDDDGNGFVDDVVGYDFVASTSGSLFYVCCDADCGTVDNDPRDHNGHGTHVAGTVAAISNNNKGVAGVAGGFSNGTTSGAGNGVKVLPLRIGWNASLFGNCGYGLVRMDSAAQALTYVADLVDRGEKVVAVNASWGSSNSGGLGAAVDNLLAKGVMIIHAAGNSNSTNPDYLGSKDGVMNVAATDRGGFGASFTNHGNWVDVAAPGVDIVSTFHDYTQGQQEVYGISSGTSMAAPHACGVAALLKSKNPALTGSQIFDLMVNNTRPYMNDGRNLGSGIVNANLALNAAGGGGGNTAPVADDRSAITDEDVAVAVTLSGSDPETCELSFSIVSGPSNGTLSGITGLPCGTVGDIFSDSAQITYTPNANFNGADSFTYKVNDGSADSNVASVSITVNPVNDAPVAANKNVSTPKDTPVLVTLTATDVDNCELTFSIVSGPSKGSLSGITDAVCTAGNPNSDSATLTYTPNGVDTGADSFTYKVNDGSVDSNTATVSINITDPGPSFSHVGDLDGATSAKGKNWQAEVTIVIHDVNHSPVADATVSGNWSGAYSATDTCTTGSNGQCSVNTRNLRNGNSVTFTVNTVTHASLTYQSGSNHDPDGDSNGGSITLNKP